MKRLALIIRFTIINLTIGILMGSCQILKSGKRDKVELTVVSWEGCCKYEVNTDDTITYYDYEHNQYEEDGYHTTYWFDDLYTAKRTIDDIEDHCHFTHNK